MSQGESCTLVAPQRNETQAFEFSIHRLPRASRRHCALVFPDQTLDDNTLVIITVQKTKHDLIAWGDEIEIEKNVCLERFFVWGHAVCEYIRLAGKGQYWADIIDPPSGYPVFGRQGPTLYSEVEGLQTMLKYSQSRVGNCHVIVHPQWLTRMYPASMFTNAPPELVTRACAAASQPDRYNAHVRWDFERRCAVRVAVADVEKTLSDADAQGVTDMPPIQAESSSAEAAVIAASSSSSSATS